MIIIIMLAFLSRLINDIIIVSIFYEFIFLKMLKNIFKNIRKNLKYQRSNIKGL